MERRDIELIEKHSSSDSVLAKLYKEHLDYERELEKLENKSYLSNDEQLRRAEVKKLKLAGKDKLEMILKKYRSQETGR